MRRFLGILAGLVAALIGTLILMSVVERSSSKEDEDAPQLASVLVVRALIPRQTQVGLVVPNVELVQIPVDLVAPGALSSLDGIQPGLVTSTELLPGEQLIIDRFVDPRVQTRIAVPEGLQEVTISLPTPQAAGGSLVAGDLVGVVASFSLPSTDETTATDGAGDVQGSATTFILHQVLITAVKFSPGDATAIEQGLGQRLDSVNRYTSDQVLITFAVSSVDAARIIFAGEYGRIWLTLEGPTATVGGEGVVQFDDLVPLTGP